MSEDYATGDVVPVFPLPDFILFPGVTVPLHIFEPRYYDLVRHVLDRGGLLCLASLTGDWQEHYYENPDLSPHACLARIVDYDSKQANRYNIMVTGVVKVSIEEAPSAAAYRNVRVVVRDDVCDVLDEGGARERLARAIVEFASGRLDDEERRLVIDHVDAMTLGDLIHHMSFTCDLPTPEKLTLLGEVAYSRILEVLLYHYGRAAE